MQGNAHTWGGCGGTAALSVLADESSPSLLEADGAMLEDLQNEM
jgi:hypothetical protein